MFEIELQNSFGEWVAKTFGKTDRCIYEVDIYIPTPHLWGGEAEIYALWVIFAV